MGSNKIYDELAKMLRKVKKEGDLSEELVAVLNLAAIDAATKVLMREHQAMDDMEALEVARMKALAMFDEIIFNGRLAQRDR